MLKNCNEGWLTFELNDGRSKVEFNASYVEDPVGDLLNLFNHLIDNGDKWLPIPSICFDGESIDTIVTFLECTTLVTILKDDAETTIIYKDWMDLLHEFMDDVNFEGFLEEYFKQFHLEDDAIKYVVDLKDDINKKLSQEDTL